MKNSLHPPKPLTVILLTILCLSSCADVEPGSIDLNEYGINTSENRRAIIEILNDRNATSEMHRNTILAYREINSQNEFGFNSSNADDVTVAEQLREYKNCNSCGSEYQEYIIPLLENLLITSNDEILGVLEEFERSIDLANIDNGIKSDLLFISFVFSATAEKALENSVDEFDQAGFWDCFKKKAGSHIGGGIAGGFITGCGAGAINGGFGGTILFPGVGTIAGIAGGCVIGGLYGAIGSGIFGGVIAAGKCLFR